MSEEPCPSHRAAGFTLIEVMAALLIFSVGVLLVIQVSGALTTQMQYAARSSEIVAVAHERLDSIAALPFDSVSAASETDTLTVEGLPYVRTLTVTPITAILWQIDVAYAPAVAGTGPSYSATTYSTSNW